MKICFFTIADGKTNSRIANALAFTFKKNTQYTLEVFTEYPERITFGNTHPLEKLSDIKNKNLFKFQIFKNIKDLVDADYYIYIDSNSYIVKSFNSLIEIIKTDDMFALLENQLTSDPKENSKNKSWYNKRLWSLKILFKEYSKQDINYYTTSSNFFGFKKEIINEIFEKTQHIESYLSNKLSNVHEDFILSILAAEYIKNTNIHLSINNYIFYAEDTLDNFEYKLPSNKSWEYKNLITDKETLINPSIIKYKGSKPIFKLNSEGVNVFSPNLLYMFSRDILSKTRYNTQSSFENFLTKLIEEEFNINFFIRCNNPYNLPIVIKSIEEQVSPNILYKIFISFNFNRQDISQDIINFCSLKSNTKILFNPDIDTETAKNIVIDLIDDGWIYQLDDDNVLYPYFLDKISKLFKENPEKECFIFHQENQAAPESINDIKFDMFDPAMYLVNRKLIDKEKIPEFQRGEISFIENLYDKYPDKFLLIKEILCFKNKFKDIE